MNGTFTTPLAAAGGMLRVIFALMMRETQTRYGRLKVGYLWAVIEPMLFVMVLTIIFTYRGRFSPHNIPPLLFFLTGIMPFMIFRDQVSQTMMAVRANRGLLSYPQVQMLDLALARSILEFSTNLLALVLLVGGIVLLDLLPVRIEDMLNAIVALFLLAALGFGLGSVLSAVVPIFPTLQFIVQMLLLRPLFFLSGIFFTVEMLPPQLRKIAVYNPVLQLIEMFRSAFFWEYSSEYVDLPYILTWVIGLLCLGLLMQRALRRYALQR